MNRSTKTVIAVAIVTAIFIFLSRSAKAGTKKNPFKLNLMPVNFYPLALKYSQEVADTANIAYQGLQDAGFSAVPLKLAFAQAFHETGAFKAGNSLVDDNNFSGIMFINKPGIQKNATRGRRFPTKEGNYYYAKFATPKDWAIDLYRILNRPPNYPIQAKNAVDFAHKLKLNKYYTDSELNYTKNVSFYYNLLTSLGI